MMQRKYRDRLLKLADFLDKLPKKLFDIGAVVECDGSAEETLPLALANPRKRCGAVACAMGWSPACFPRQIKWKWDDDIVLKDDSTKNWWGTAERFFGLTSFEVNYLFTHEYYGPNPNPTPKQVAKVIRKFVSDGKYRVGGYYEDKWEVRPAG